MLIVAYLVMVVTKITGGSFIDLFDLSVYYLYAERVVTSGELPYIDFPVEYPQLAMPHMIVLFAIAAALGTPMLFVYLHAILMFGFYVVATLCVYFIALDLYDDEHRAYIAGIIMATAFSCIYFVLTKYDALPTCCMMVALLLFVKRRSLAASATTAIGGMTKWVPFIALPYMIIHDWKNNAKNAILPSIGIVLAIVGVVLIPCFIASTENTLFAYSFHFGRQAQSESIYFFIDYLLGFALTAQFSTILTVGSQLIILGMYWRGSASVRRTIIYISLALFAFIVLNKVFSPQYILWIAPLLALHFSDSGKKIALFVAMQILMFIEYPLTFGFIQVTTEYYDPLACIILYSCKFVVWGIAFVVLAKTPTGDT